MERERLRDGEMDSLVDSAVSLGLGEAYRNSHDECGQTPAQAQETLADDAVAQTTSHGHIRLPCLCQNPAERGQEKEMEEGCHQGAHDLREREREKQTSVNVITGFSVY